MNYETVRGFADSWGLLLLVILFLAVILFVFRRGSTKRYEDAARIPMESREKPGKPGAQEPGHTDNDAAAANESGEDR
ncbi:MAG: hypothetical protein AcusKO_37930 [Acuticoccus sp.]